jgi:GT2 family glycosyltransferase
MGNKKALKDHKFRIWEFIPYGFDLDYGSACNKYFELVPNDDDWVAIRDTDILSLTPAHMHKIRETIQKYPDTGLFTCLTNRVKQYKQVANMDLFENPDIRVHRDLALKLVNEPINAPVINYVISGYLMIMKKSTWKKIGGFPSGVLGVDNKVSYRIRQAGMEVRMMRNVYFFHYYRFNEGINDKSHLKK